MKKTILSFVLLAGVFTANAQNAGPATGNSTVKVNLYPLQSITVNPANKDVQLDYKTSENYLTGVNKTQADHLTVFSTAGFKVNVKSNDASLTTVNSGRNIDLKDIKITASQGSKAEGSPFVFTGVAAVALTDGDQEIGSGASAGSGNINVNYAAAGNNAYLTKLVAGRSVTQYTANVIYSIIAS